MIIITCCIRCPCTTVSTGKSDTFSWHRINNHQDLIKGLCALCRCPNITIILNIIIILIGYREIRCNWLTVLFCNRSNRGIIYSECQRILCTFVVHINNRISLCRNRDILVKMIQMKSGILLIYIIDTGVCIVASTLLLYCINRSSNSTLQRDSLFEIISIFIKVFQPDKDCIICPCIRNPTGINGCLIRQRLCEIILSTTRCLISLCFGSKPSAKGISVTGHIGIVRSGRGIP